MLSALDAASAIAKPEFTQDNLNKFAKWFHEKFVSDAKKRDQLKLYIGQLFSNESLPKIRRKDSKLPFSLLRSTNPVNQSDCVFLVTAFSFNSYQTSILSMYSPQEAAFKIVYPICKKIDGQFSLDLSQPFFLKINRNCKETKLPQTAAPVYPHLEHYYNFQRRIIGRIGPDGSLLYKKYDISPMLAGHDLSDVIDKADEECMNPVGARLSFKHRLFIAYLVIIELQKLHCYGANGFVHCDLKPDNIRIIIFNPNAETPENFAKIILIDLDSSHIASVEEKIFTFTPAYIAPEVARGKAVIRPSLDIFAYGIILSDLFFSTNLSDERSKYYDRKSYKYRRAGYSNVEELLPEKKANYKGMYQTAFPNQLEYFENLWTLMMSCVATKKEHRPSTETVSTQLKQYVEQVKLMPPEATGLTPDAKIPSAANMVF